jgi:molybdopterin-binding protein
MHDVPGRRPLRYGCAMELSARNQLKGTVKRVAADGVMAEVVVDIGGPEIVSTITKASAERLKLRTGDAVVVFVKASDVMIGK